MKTSDFDFHLPTELIAQEPAPCREDSRLLVVHRAEGRIEHRSFKELPRFLRKGDLLVLNDTRVIPARLFGTKDATGGKVELLLLEEVGPHTWDVLLRASRRPKPGDILVLAEGQARATLIEDGDQGRARIDVLSERPFMDLVEESGLPPLPPYIKRAPDDATQTRADRERYQTVYARHPGAIAAPTAGLHFTSGMLAELERGGVGHTAVTLHVGLGTFRPVSAETVEDHVMEDERYAVPGETARRIAEVSSGPGRVIAVGSTSVRTLETMALEHGRSVASEGRSRLFIYPPFEFKLVDVMVTNFHLPKSTLIMMVCAFGGTDLILRAYEEAVRERYRFYSYGDCMLVL